MTSLFNRSRWDDLEALVPGYLRRRSIDTGREKVSTARILDVFPLTSAETEVWFLIVQLEFRSGLPETVSLPLAFVALAELPQLLGSADQFGFAAVIGATPGVLCYALAVPSCCRGLLTAIQTGKVVAAVDQELATLPFPADRTTTAPLASDMQLTLKQSSKDNASVVFGQEFIYKSFSRVEEGTNPDLEIGRVMTSAGYSGAAQVVGYTEYRRRGTEPATLGVLHRFVSNQGTAWQYTLDHLSGYFERVAALSREQPPVPPPGAPLIKHHESDPKPDGWHELIGNYPETSRLIARRTAEMHTALGKISDPGFISEPFGKLYQRSIYQSLRTLSGRLCQRLTQERSVIPLNARPLAERLIAAESDILRLFRTVLDPGLGGFRIRCHGDYHLDQLLYTGKDFVVIDFEGEPGRTIGERRLKKSPLQDVAAMVRSFDYAVQSVLFGLASSRGRSAGLIRAEDSEILGAWATAWYDQVASEYVTGYVEQMADAGLLPPSEERLRVFLEVLILEQALHEIDLELTHRPEWLVVPLRGAVRLLGYDPNHADLHR